MPNVLNGADATIVSKVAEAFTALDSLYDNMEDRLRFIAAAFNSLGGEEAWAAKEALKQEAFVKPRVEKGLKADSINIAWMRFKQGCEKYGIVFDTWKVNTPEAVKKREQRKTAEANKPKAVAEAEAKLKALKEEAAAKAKAEAAELKETKEKLRNALKAMGPRELEKVLHFALKVAAGK